MSCCLSFIVNAKMIAHQSYDTMGDIIKTDYEWQGPDNGMIGMSGKLMANFATNPDYGDVIKLGGFDLVIMEIDHGLGVYGLKRLDVE